MLNDNSLREVAQARFDPGSGALWTKPQYDSYCFSQIPATITRLLTGVGNAGLPVDVLGSLPQRYRRVVLFFVDAFGWRFFERYADRYPALQRLVDEGIISKLTAQFPSTTAAHVTCIHTGLPVGQSGVYEWNIYEPRLDRIITPLLWSFAGDKARNTLVPTGVAADEVLPRGDFYRNLRRASVQPEIFQPAEYTPSPYTNVVTAGVDPEQLHGYNTWPEALTLLTERLRLPIAGERAFYYVYFDKIDTIGHTYGPSSPHFDAEVDSFWTTMERLFFRKVAGRVADTLVMITADHGQIETDPRTTLYLNRDLDDQRVRRYLQRNRASDVLAPAGSPRDMFLHVRDDYLAEAHSYFKTALTDRAEVYLTSELIGNGFFGSEAPSRRLLDRVGNLVILPYARETVWWYEPERFVQSSYGHHGGLTPEEMETPLFCYAL